MKGKMGKLFFLFGLLLSMPVTAYADTLSGADNWSVVFTGDNKMESNFGASDLNDVMGQMQPGDNAVITLTLQNDNASETDWYMMNEVISSLEESTKASAAMGAAYTYRLVYTGPSGSQKTLFDSDTVGGESPNEAGKGLEQATDALKDYFFLDTLKRGEGGRITLEIALDGNTTGNAYQDTRANLMMQFAVEVADSGRGRTSTVRTGDETALAPLIIAAFVSGFVLIVFAGSRLGRQNREEEGAE